MLIIVWVLLCIAVALLAGKRGRSGGGWFLFSLVISPLLGFIFLLVIKDLSKDVGVRLPCPKCSENILIEAKNCPFCKHDVENDNDFKVAVQKHHVDLKDGNKNLIIGIGFIASLFAIAKLIDTYF